MQKSEFLEKVLARAEDIAQKNERKSDADYFVLAVLERMVELGAKDNAVYSPDEDKTRQLIEISIRDGLNEAQAFNKMYKEKKATPRNFSASAIFNRIMKMCEENEGEATVFEAMVTTVKGQPIVVRKFFDSPADALIEKIRSGKAEDEEEAKEEPTPAEAEDDGPISDDDFWDSIVVKLSSDDEEEKKEEKVEEAKEEPTETMGDVIRKIKSVQKNLLEVVFGQDHAVNAFVSGYFQAEMAQLAGKTADKPKATFLFAGPPGTGKTFLAERISAEMGIPYHRFDMSEFSNANSLPEFFGYMNYSKSKQGAVTGFVNDNPKCILLFDEIEKAHIGIIHLFLQILDAGRLRDEYLEKEVSFSDAVLIFTTNAGRKLYENLEIENLSALPRKQVLEALALDKNPASGEQLFPDAICSRFASGNVVMFNRLTACNLLKIASKELDAYTKAFEKKSGASISISDQTVFSMMLAEGGKVDARNIRGRAARFFSTETYELMRLMTSESRKYDIDALKKVTFEVAPPEREDVASLFAKPESTSVLVFTSARKFARYKKLGEEINLAITDDLDVAKEVLLDDGACVALIDVKCGDDGCCELLNIEDSPCDGVELFNFVTESIKIPTFIVEDDPDGVSYEEEQSFIRSGAQGVVCLQDEGFVSEVIRLCITAEQQNKLMEISSVNKILSYRTRQTLSKDGSEARIELFDLRLVTAPDADDSNSLVSDMAKPAVRFGDVIGAEDAKSELQYFVNYMKNPAEFMKKGVRAPKGVLLYGPPGTGKTLLAKAMAGESDVTFIAAEGNQFLKKFVGEGSEAVHELFRRARKYAPTVLFIDEIDAIGKNRDTASASEVTSADTLTALLTEMDGFKSQTAKPVFVLAATNFSVEEGGGKSLDPALVRRFDRKILIDLPEKADRLRYIRMQLSKHPTVKLSEDEIESIATRSVSMSLADLELVFELALRNAIKSDLGEVDDAQFEEAFESYNSGAVKAWSKETLERTARHEAGHALLCWLNGETPSYLTIVARANHGGYMQRGDSVEKQLFTRAELLGNVRTALAGRAAELVYYGDEDGVTTGASGDLASATDTVERMVCRFGMVDEIGLSYLDLNKLDKAAYAEVRAKINAILSEQLEEAKSLIVKYKKAVDGLVEALLNKNQLKGNEIEAIITAAING